MSLLLLVLVKVDQQIHTKPEVFLPILTDAAHRLGVNILDPYPYPRRKFVLRTVYSSMDPCGGGHPVTSV